MKEAEAGLVAADVLAVWHWWLEERWLVVVCWVVKTAVVCQSVGSSSQIRIFMKKLESPDMLC